MGTSDVREMDRSKSHVFIEPVLLQNSYFSVLVVLVKKSPCFKFVVSYNIGIPEKPSLSKIEQFKCQIEADSL